MIDNYIRDGDGAILRVETYGGENNLTLLLVYDLENNTLTNYSNVPEEERIKPLSEEVRVTLLRKEESDTTLSKIEEALSQMQHIRDLAEADQSIAADMRDAAQAESQTTSALSQQAGVLGNKTTLAITDLRPTIQGVGQLASSLSKTQQALANQYEYRRQNDIALVTAYDAIIYLARKVTQ